jgi:hypothetical protein
MCSKVSPSGIGWIGWCISSVMTTRVSPPGASAMKRWRRDWKIELIERRNRTWRDLFADLVQADGFEW